MTSDSITHKKVSTLFKYIGGKSWLKEQLRERISYLLTHKKTDIHSYVEPFSGGLGAFLNIYDLLITHDIHHIILNDINTEIIHFYTLVQNNPQQLIEQYMLLEDGFKKTVPSLALNNLHHLHDKIRIKQLLHGSHHYFNSIRLRYNELRAIPVSEQGAFHYDMISACLLFLQNHSFNGIYRENAKGQYNTPFNWSGKVYTIEQIEQKILTAHHIFKQFNIQFTNFSYEKIDYNLQSLYYLDPPYLNVHTLSENKYHQEQFSIGDQEKLIYLIKDTSFLYSNHDSLILDKFFDHYIQNKKYFDKNIISRKNIISASSESRKIDKVEMLVSHYLL